MKASTRGCLWGVLTGGIMFMLYVFAVFTVIVSLISGIADVILYSRKVQSQGEALLESGGEGLQVINYTPNLISGLTAFLLLIASTVMSVLLFRKKYGVLTHWMVIASTLLAAFIFLLPRPELGTGTGGMKEVYAYLCILGVFQSSLFRTYVMPLGDGPRSGGRA